MNTEITFRAELSVPGERIMHHLKLYNADLEKQIDEGINAAMKEIDVSEIIKRGILKDFESTIWSTLNRWSLQNDFKVALQEKIQEKIKEYAEKIAETLAKQLDIKGL